MRRKQELQRWITERISFKDNLERMQEEIKERWEQQLQIENSILQRYVWVHPHYDPDI